MIELQNTILNFFDSVRAAGGVPWTFYLENFNANDFGLALRIEEDLAQQNKGIAIMIGLAVLILTILIIVCTITILKSQSKTRKMLRELIEIQHKKEPEEDKPAGEP